MNKELLGLIFLPTGIMLMCVAAVFQLYVMMTETYTLNRYKDKALVWRVAVLFLSFSLAVYWLCPNARKKGVLFFIMGGGGILMYALARIWLPFAR